MKERETLTPTWSGSLDMLLDALTTGSKRQKRMAREQLARMAALADRYVDEMGRDT